MAIRAKRFLSDHQYIDLSEFPINPEQGTSAFKHGVYYIYSMVGDLPAWCPLNRSVMSYVHNQGTNNSRWTVHHGLATNKLVVTVYNSVGALIPSTVTHAVVADVWLTYIDFPIPTVGHALFFSDVNSRMEHLTANDIAVLGNLTVKGVDIPLSPTDIKLAYESNDDTHTLTDKLLADISKGVNGGQAKLFDNDLF